MRWVFLLTGIAVGALSTFIGTVYLDIQRQERTRNEPIIFAAKDYYDTGNIVALQDGFVAVSGTLTGNGVKNKINQYSIACIKDRKECVVAAVEQIGHNQIGRMEAPVFYPIKKWTTDEIIAEEDPLEFRCHKATITIDRKQEILLWVQEPINRARPLCRNADATLHKWTIEDDPFWKRPRAR